MWEWICKRQRVNKQHLPYICFWHITYIHHPHLLFYCFISFFASSHCSIPNGSRCNGDRGITLTRTPRLIVEYCNVFSSTNYNTLHRQHSISSSYCCIYIAISYLCLSSLSSAILIPLLLALSIFLRCCRCCAAYHIINIIGWVLNLYQE